MTFESAKVPDPLQVRAQAPEVGAGSWRFRTASALAALGSWTAALITRYEALFVSAAAAGCAFVQAWNSFRPLWFDELFTFFVSRLPDLDHMFRAMPADGNPPLYHLLARVSLRLLGETSFAVRLPSILAFTAAALAVYCFVRRRRGPVLALFAMLALACSGMAKYGSEARPYALLLAFTGLTLVSWQAATEENRPRLMPLIGVALGIAGRSSSTCEAQAVRLAAVLCRRRRPVDALCHHAVCLRDASTSARLREGICFVLVKAHHLAGTLLREYGVLVASPCFSRAAVVNEGRRHSRRQGRPASR